ncbi:radical SAM protein [Bradyrhizobium guangzhouense]|nr:radical SAM protein [Bradyrhizobium guangzhouense]
MRRGSGCSLRGGWCRPAWRGRRGGWLGFGSGRSRHGDAAPALLDIGFFGDTTGLHARFVRSPFGDARLVAVPPKYDYLADGDVIGFDHASRKFRTLYRRSSAHNSLLVTERCNHYCLMCSQPPKDVDDRWILSEIKESLPLIDRATRALTFTGGETLSDWEDFTGVLKECRDRLPATAIQVLTNGRAFSDSRIVDAWKNIGHPNLMAAIPVYASVDHVHDNVVQAKGAFDETILGILKLKDRGQRVEIRVVLHALTAPIIEDTGRWIARNLPFVDHVALMGLENTGFAIANDAILWMDPISSEAMRYSTWAAAPAAFARI